MQPDYSGIAIRYGVSPCPFGDCFVAITDKGVCALSFPDEHGIGDAVAGLRNRWRNANLVEDAKNTGYIVKRIFERRRRRDAPAPNLDVRGTAFQFKVWEALVRMPKGSTASYEEIAIRIGHPKAVRAVGNAVARNPVAFLIPCHRVIRKTGAIGNYRWGAERKQAILSWEAAGLHLSTGTVR